MILRVALTISTTCFSNIFRESALQTLLDLTNGIWETGDFPSIWKLVNGIPIPKPGKDHSELSNCRPIALTSCVCETIERMINSRIAWFLESNGLLSNIKYRFRQGKSTVDYLVRFETFIRIAVAKKEHAVSIFFYLEKAYDTTWKYGILKDLLDIGLIGKLPTFISNFLSERSELSYSGIHEQMMGVPEGSILSLFSIEINSLAKGLNDNVECYLYVDDFLICIQYNSNYSLYLIYLQMS